MTNYTNPMDMMRHALDQQDRIYELLYELLMIMRDIQARWKENNRGDDND